LAGSPKTPGSCLRGLVMHEKILTDNLGKN
jgi:hypothetical protein